MGKIHGTQSSGTVMVTGATGNSPAAKAGLRSGDVIVQAGAMKVIDGVDLERALLSCQAGTSVPVTVRRNGKMLTVPLTLQAHGQGRPSAVATTTKFQERTWKMFGVHLKVISRDELVRQHGTEVLEHYNGGLRVTKVRKNGPASRNGIRKGDVLVGLHEWETVSADNVRFVLEHPQLSRFSPVKFYILRNRDTLFGHLPVPSVKR